MAFKTFAPGVLTSSDVNTFLMQQAVITCTSSTRPSSPIEGMTIYETDTDRYKTYSGSAWEDGFKSGAWIAYTPTLGGFGAGTDWVLGNASIDCAYQKVGRLVVGRINIAWGSTSVFGTKSLLISQPVAPKSGLPATNGSIGTFVIWDTSTSNLYPGHLEQAGGSNINFGLNANSLSWDTQESITSTRPFTWANGDYLTASFIYEAAA